MYWLIPLMDVFWGLFTLLQYRSSSYGELAAYRFLVGWFEVNTWLRTLYPSHEANFTQAAFFPAMHYVFGK
jgi:hypothetical protein